MRWFIGGLLMSGLAATVVQQAGRLSMRTQLDRDAATFEATINERIAANLGVLRGAAGMFAILPQLTRDQFDDYFRQVGVEQNYPGVRGVGLTRRVAPGQVADFVAAAQREGWPDFHIWPAGRREEYHSILFLAPLDARNRVAIGYDMHTEAVRRAAMDRARDSGKPAATGKVTLVQEIDEMKQPGFLIYVPFFHDGAKPATETDRHRRLAGYAYAAFRTGDFVNAILARTRLQPGRLSLYDGPTPDEASLIYRRDDGDARGYAVTHTQVLWIVDRPWTLEYVARANGIVSPLAVVLLGAALSAVVGVLVAGVDRARRRAERSEAATRQREGELALLVDAVPALVSYVDSDGILRLANRRYSDWFGADPKALVDRPVAEVVGPEIFREIGPVIRRVLAGEGMVNERWFNLPGVGARYLGTIYVPHRGDSGRIVGCYVLTSDLTRHKRSEEAALFVADCGRLLIESMDFEATARGIVHLAVPRLAEVAVLFRADEKQLRASAVAHVDGRIERQLSEFLEDVRLPTTAPHDIGLAARTGSVVVSSDLRESELARGIDDPAQREMLRALKLRSALHVPVTVRGRIWAVFSFGTSVDSGRQFTDEHRQLAEEISTRVRLAVENALLYREAQQEIEERRRAERVARETEERFRLVIESVRDYAIIALDADGRVASWNEGAQRLLGFDEAEAIGMSAALFFTPEDQSAHVPGEELRRACDAGAATEERWFRRRDGTLFWASSHTVLLRNDDGEIRGYARIMRDLTDRKRMEEELERRVQARTAELHEAVHELESFSYSVSHDLRAPLRTIRGFTELALEEAGGRLTEDERGYLERVRRAASRLEQLISDLLAYTRVSKAQVELVPVALQNLVSDIQREHPEFQPPRADVQTEGPLLPVVGNAAYLTQCVTNLLGNAVKFVHQDQQPVVRVWTERRGSMVRFYVRDNGIGIAPERLSKAFEMFERLHTSGSYEGTGVGLAIVRRAVQRMQGNVGVTSEVGKGTTFWIELPAAD